MQVIHELSWLWKGIGIIALASAIVLIAAFKLHKEEYKIEIACIIFIVTTLIISKKPGNTGISRDIRTEFTTDLLLSD